MNESERNDSDPVDEPPQRSAPDPAPQSDAAPPPAQFGDQDAGRRRRRGRRGRGGGGFSGPRPPMGGAQRPQFGGQQFRGPQPFPSEESEQARELAGYERRQAQRQRGPQGWRGGGQGGGGWRQRRGGEQRYSDAIRRVTAGPRTTAPSHIPAGEPIAGPHAILEALRAGRTIRRLYVSHDRNARTGPVNELITEAQQRRIFIRYTDKMEIARLSPVENHQGVVAIVEGKAGVEFDELLLHMDTLSAPALVLILDSLQDPQNFGVLLRSAEAVGVDGVVIPHHRSVGLTGAVAKTSAGASEHLLIADVANLRQAIDALKEKGIWVVGADESGDALYDEVDYRGPTAIVIGGEGEGIRRLVLEGCDQLVRLPMEGQVTSLNAAAAGSILLYEALRQRRRDVPPAQTRTPRPGPIAQNGSPEEKVADEPVGPMAVEADESEALPAASAGDANATVEEAKPVEEPPKKTTRRRSTKKSAE